MSLHDEHMADRIEQYLLGHMRPEDRLAFEAEMDKDAALAEEVRFQKTLMASVEHARKEELKARLRENLHEEKRGMPAWLAAAAVIIVIIVAALFFLRPGERRETAKTIRSPRYTPLAEPQQNLTISTDTVPPPKGAQSRDMAMNESKPLPKTSFQTATESLSVAYDVSSPVVKDTEGKKLDESDQTVTYADKMTTYNYSTSAPSAPVLSQNNKGSSESYDVQTDVLLKDSSLPVFALTTFSSNWADSTQFKEKEQAPSPSRTSSVRKAEKRSARSQPVSSVSQAPIENLQIQYWQSPVNFNGYRYFRNHLDLYGIAPKDKIQLLRWSGNLYLKNNKTLYKLTEQNDYSNFVPVKEPSVLSNFGL